MSKGHGPGHLRAGGGDGLAPGGTPARVHTMRPPPRELREEVGGGRVAANIDGRANRLSNASLPAIAGGGPSVVVGSWGYAVKCMKQEYMSIRFNILLFPKNYPVYA